LLLLLLLLLLFHHSSFSIYQLAYNAGSYDVMFLQRKEQNICDLCLCKMMEVGMALKMLIVAFLVVTPCYFIDGYQRFRGTYQLHIQGRTRSVTTYMITWCHTVEALLQWRWSLYVLLKR
jgi:hypothetical protein